MADDTGPDDTGATPPGGNADQGTPPADLGDAGKQAIDRMKAERNAARAELKAANDKLAELERSSLQGQEKAVADAVAAAKAEAFNAVAAKLAAAEFKVAANGRFEVTEDFLSGVNLAAFVDASGDVDTDKVKAFIDGITPAGAKPAPDLGQGVRSAEPQIEMDPRKLAERVPSRW